MMLAAHIREAFGLPGMTAEQTIPFRDKERMKQVLDAAGIRTPRHSSTSTVSGAWEAAERIGYPLIVKPIAGAGSADTYRVDSPEELAEVLTMVRHVDVISVEEFVEAEEFTHDTVCAGGEILFENVCWYRPRPLQARSHEWVSPMTVALRDLDDEQLRAGREMGRGVLEGARLPGRLHPHGVVSQGRRRGGLRRDRRPATGWPHGRRDELRHRRRPLPGLGRGGRPRPDLAPARAPLQRRQHLQAGRGLRADPAHRRARPTAQRVRRLGGRARPAAGRRAPPGLAGHPDLGRHGDRPPPGARRR